MTQFGLAIVWCAIQVAVVGLGAGLILLASRRLAPAARAKIALVGLLLVGSLTALALAPLPSWFDVGTASGRSDSASAASTLARADAAENPQQQNASMPDRGAATNEPSPDASSAPAVPSLLELWLDEMQAAPSAASAGAPAGDTRWWPTTVAIAFLALGGVGLLQVCAGLLLVRHYRRASVGMDDDALAQQVDLLRAELGCHRRVEVRQSPHLTTAATIGWLRPVVLLPSAWRTWQADELRAVLAHELAHIARRDYAACLLAQLGLALHYYQPLVHWLVGRLRLEQELAADAAAAAVSGGREKYLRILAELALQQADHRLPLPARSFLPTRSTFLRRVNMLRNPLTTAAHSRTLLLTAALALLVVVAVGAAGLRLPGASPAIAGPPATAAGDSDDKAGGEGQMEPFDLRSFPRGNSFVVAFRPAEILSHPKLGPLAKTLAEATELQKSLGLPLADIEQVILAMPSPEEARLRREKMRAAAAAGNRPRAPMPMRSILIRSTKPLELESLEGFDSIVEGAVQRRHGAKTYFEVAAPNEGAAYFQPDRRTFVYGPRSEIVSLVAGTPSTSALLQTAGWRQVERDNVAAAIDPAAFSQAMEVEAGNPLTTNLALIRPLLSECRGLYYGGRFGEVLHLKAVADCGAEGDTKPVKETIQALLTLGRNASGEANKAISDDVIRTNPLAPFALDLATALLDSAKVTTTSARSPGQGRVRLVEVDAQAPLDAEFGDAFAKSIVAARAAAERQRAMNNLRQIAIALHNYADQHGHLPAASILGPDGKTPHSWRVALLPYLEQQALYKEYRLDEPWDSEHNKKLLTRMPAVYRLPGEAEDTINAGTFVLTGDDAGFPGEPKEKGYRFLDLRDGTSNTIFAVEADREIPWTKPADISYVPGTPLPALGGYSDEGFNVAMFDGSVRFEQYPRTAEQQKRFRALITKSGGETVR